MRRSNLVEHMIQGLGGLPFWNRVCFLILIFGIGAVLNLFSVLQQLCDLIVFLFLFHRI